MGCNSRPIVALKIVTDKNCEKCKANDFFNQVQDEIIPTLQAQEIDYNSAEGKKIIADFNVKSLPALFFDVNIEKAAVFEKVKNNLIKKDDLYYLGAGASGIPPGKFLEAPKVSAEDRLRGSQSAPVTIIEFCSFTSLDCKNENDIVKQVLLSYSDKVRVVFKHLFSPSDSAAQLAAEAESVLEIRGNFLKWRMYYIPINQRLMLHLLQNMQET